MRHPGQPHQDPRRRTRLGSCEQVSELNNSNEVLIEVRQKQEDVIESVTAKRDGYANTIKSQDAEIERLTKWNNRLRKSAEDNAELHRASSTDAIQCHKRVEQLNQQVETAQRRIAELEETDRHKTKRIQGDSVEIVRLRKKVSLLEKQSAGCKRIADNSDADVNRLQKTVDEQGCAIAKLREENEHLRSISDTRRKGLESLDQEAEDLGKTCGLLRVENEKLSAQNSDLVKTEANLRRQNMEMGQRIHEQNGTILQEIAAKTRLEKVNKNLNAANERQAKTITRMRKEQPEERCPDCPDAGPVKTVDCKTETPRSFETATDIAGPLKPIPFDHHLANKVIMAMPERVAFQMEAKLDGTIHLILHGRYKDCG